MSKKNPLYMTGVTITGDPVVGGLFEMSDTHGFPLTESLCQLRERGWCPDWHDYIGSAIRAGWTDEQIEQRINTAMSEAECPVEWRDNVRSLIPLSINYHRLLRVIVQKSPENPG